MSSDSGEESQSGNDTSSDGGSSDGNSDGSSDGDESSDASEWPELPDDDDEAVTELMSRIEQRGGQEPLVQPSMEFAES